MPVVAEVLVQTSHREIIKSLRKDLCSLLQEPRQDDGHSLSSVPPASGHVDSPKPAVAADHQPAAAQQRQSEVEAMQRLLHGHPLCEKYLDRLAQLHKKQSAKAKKRVAVKSKNVDSDASESPSSPSSVEDAKGGALTFACLDQLDDKNRQEWAKDVKTKALTGLAGVKLSLIHI